MDSLIDELHRKGQANNYLRHSLLRGERITVYVPSELAKESAKESLLILGRSIEKEIGSPIPIDYKIVVGKAPAPEGKLNEDGRTIVRLCGYLRY